MKKVIFMLVLITFLYGMDFESYAVEIEKDIAVNAKTQYDITDVIEGVRVDVDEIKVELEDGTVIRATGEFEDTVRLMVMPITKSMTKEWNWLQSVTKKIGENKSCYDIFFINSSGKRVDGGEGSQISVMTNSKIKNLAVYYIESNGKEKQLDSTVEEYVVKFKMMKNGYYTLLTKGIPKKQSSSSTTKKPSNKKPTSSKNDNDVDDDNDKDKDEDKEDIKDEEEIKEDDDFIDDEEDSNDKTLDDLHEDTSDEDDKDKDDSSGKRPDGSSTDNGEKDKSIGDIITLLSIVFVFIGTGIIFLIILKKKKKEKEEEE